MTRVAIVHDDLTQRGGAERVVLSLSRLFPGAPIFTTVYAPERTYPEFRDLDVRTTGLQKLRRVGSRALLPLYPAAIRSIDLSGFELAVSSTSRFAHGVRVPDGHHVAYCHNPPRFLYQADTYFSKGGPIPAALRPALRPVLSWLRRHDQAAARRPDLYVANSHTVAERIEATYGRVAPVVHPPVDLRRFAGVPLTPAPATPSYVVVSRLLPYKRIDLVVDACTRRDVPLLVVGTGPAEAALRRRAGATVRFRSGVSDAELGQALAAATALVQPGVEDYGLAPVEANAVGRPAVVFARGGGRETVADGVNGVWFEEQSVDALVAAMERIEKSPWDPEILARRAAHAGESRFHQALLRLLESTRVEASPSTTTT